MDWTKILAAAAAGILLAVPVLAMDEKMHGHGEAKGTQGAPPPMESLGERVFLGKAGPWNAEARLIDMKAQLTKSGVSAEAIAKLTAKHHLMVILTDPKTGNPVLDVSGDVAITGPDKGSSSKVALIVMGGHIGADVALPKPGKYSFQVTAQGGGKKGSAEFRYELKK